MPLYEYRCETCGEREEKLESFSAPDEHPCGQCGAEAGMKRQLSVSAFNLAGGGWHSQGYSGPAPEKKAAETAPAPTPPAGCPGGCGCHTPAKDN